MKLIPHPHRQSESIPLGRQVSAFLAGHVTVNQAHTQSLHTVERDRQGDT